MKSILAVALVGLACARPIKLSSSKRAAAAAARAPRFAGAADPVVTAPERLTSPLCKVVDPGPALLRRLTRFEYNNTIRDLLEDDSRPGDDFPTEEKRDGFDNNAEALTVSPLLSEQYLLAAERLATTYLEKHDDEQIAASSGCNLGSEAGEGACAEKVLASLGLRAYRRPPSREDMQTLLGVYATGRMLVAGTKDRPFRNGLRLALTALLQSPRLLYRIERGIPARPGETITRLDSWDMASRLSYLLWATTPDQALLDAAGKDELRTREQIRAQATRMLGDSKARAMVARFHEQWLELDRIDGAEKDPKVYKSFNKGIAALMREETDRFLDHVVWDGDGDVAALLTAPYTFIDGTLAKFYGLPPLDLPLNKEGRPQNRFMRVALDGERRAGFLTQGTFLAALANANQTSPVKRGLFVRERLLCERLPPPPPNAMIELPDLDPNLTTRERFEEHALEIGCIGCHKRMDPIGLGFENFDGAGIWRETENDKPLDASGEIRGWGDGAFTGVTGLAKKLAASDQVKTCITRRWFEYANGREVAAESSDTCSLEVARRRFAAGGFKIRDLLAALTETDAFLYRRVTPTEGSPSR